MKCSAQSEETFFSFIYIQFFVTLLKTNNTAYNNKKCKNVIKHLKHL